MLIAISSTALAGGYHHHGYRGYGYYGGDLAAALVIGGMFGYLIADNQPYYGPYGYRTYYYGYPPPSTVVYQQVERVPTVITTARNPEFAGNDCVMTREYTTTIRINGVARQAYGTRCMTADGGWILGPPKLMPEP
ncbi:MAG: hypothetical protein PVG22_07860 [Chromatiales bacterium]